MQAWLRHTCKQTEITCGFRFARRLCFLTASYYLKLS
jgi:hypothetical protein